MANRKTASRADIHSQVERRPPDRELRKYYFIFSSMFLYLLDILPYFAKHADTDSLNPESESFFQLAKQFNIFRCTFMCQLSKSPRKLLVVILSGTLQVFSCTSEMITRICTLFIQY